MDIVVISLVALLASVLTFFSGFGLGTILMPVFALFFPLDIAIALTGLVHFANNLFKIVLVGRHAQKLVLFRFGVPAIAASFAGAWLLLQISGMPVLAEYSLAGKTFTMTPIKLIIGSLLLVFSILELTPGFKKIHFGKDKLIYGGLLSGFFGGLTGIQGAIRSAFLIKTGLTKEAYIATGVVIACFIDMTRLSVYASRYSNSGLSDNMTLIVAATLSAMLGAVAGNFLLKKITLSFIQIVVAVMLILISLAMISGMV